MQFLKKTLENVRKNKKFKHLTTDKGMNYLVSDFPTF